MQLDNGRAVPVGRLVRQHLRGTRTHARASTRACTPGCDSNTHFHSTAQARPLHICMCTLTCPHHSGASGRGGRCWARHGWAPPISAIAGRCGVYNHLNIMLLGVLQLLYNMMAGASAGNDGRSGRRATTRLCFDGRGCQRADREPARARRTSEWHQGFMHVPIG